MEKPKLCQIFCINNVNPIQCDGHCRRSQDVAILAVTQDDSGLHERRILNNKDGNCYIVEFNEQL